MEEAEGAKALWGTVVVRAVPPISESDSESEVGEEGRGMKGRAAAGAAMVMGMLVAGVCCASKV